MFFIGHSIMCITIVFCDIPWCPELLEVDSNDGNSSLFAFLSHLFLRPAFVSPPPPPPLLLSNPQKNELRLSSLSSSSSFPYAGNCLTSRGLNR